MRRVGGSRGITQSDHAWNASEASALEALVSLVYLGHLACDSNLAYALFSKFTYQIFTRSFGSRHILSPGFTSNAFMKASLFVSGTNARAVPGECGFVSS